MDQPNTPVAEGLEEFFDAEDGSESQGADASVAQDVERVLLEEAASGVEEVSIEEAASGVEEVAIEEAASGIEEVAIEEVAAGDAAQNDRPGGSSSPSADSTPQPLDGGNADSAETGGLDGMTVGGHTVPLDGMTVGGHTVPFPVLAQEPDEQLSEEEVQERLERAVEAKTRGNDNFRKQDFTAAIADYTKAIELCPAGRQEGAPFYMNRAAAEYYVEQYEQVVEDASKAIELQEDYVKAWSRRGQAQEKLERYQEALDDFKQVLVLSPHDGTAQDACRHLEPLAEQQREKLKEEMMGKLKDLGNMCLKPFGLSTNNFQMVQDPASGGYSMNFVQNAGK